MFKQNYYACNPLDENDDETFAERFKTCKEIKEEIEGNFEEGEVAINGNFADDIPSHIYDFVNRKILLKLIYAKNFTSNPNIRDETKLLFTEIFRAWTG